MRLNLFLLINVFFVGFFAGQVMPKNSPLSTFLERLLIFLILAQNNHQI
jgi:hypothetical protein